MRWAEAYERAGSKIYCQERVINNVRHDQGEFVKAKSVPRQTFELMTAAVKPALNDNREAKEWIKQEQKQKDAALNQYGREMAARHRTALSELAALYRETKDEVTRSLRAEIAATKQALKEAQRPEWKKLYQEQWKETRQFERPDQTLAGRIGHALQAGRLEGESRIGGSFGRWSWRIDVWRRSRRRRNAPAPKWEECLPSDEGRCGHAQGRVSAGGRPAARPRADAQA